MGTIRKIKLSIKWLFGNVPIRVTTKEGNSTSWRRLVIIGDFNNYYWGHHPPCKKTAPYPPTKPAVTIQVPKKCNEPTVIRSTVSCSQPPHSTRFLKRANLKICTTQQRTCTYWFCEIIVNQQCMRDELVLFWSHSRCNTSDYITCLVALLFQVLPAVSSAFYVPACSRFIFTMRTTI